MEIAIIDAEIVGKNKHRFPNLVCMKLSSYYKSLGNNVILKLDYENLEEYDIVFISKVFIKTEIPFENEDKELKTEETIIRFYENHPILSLSNVRFGGTGFYYDKSPKLEEDIEHCKPDYHLYDNWVQSCIDNGAKRKEFTYYLDYSVGFLTRGCFRQCEFCVNRNYKTCVKHSDISEFIDPDRSKICFLDDNFFACPEWETIIASVKKYKKPFQFKQGLDERLLTKRHVNEILTWKYDGDYIFAFDNIKDKEKIESKLKLFYSCGKPKHRLKFYIFCGFDRENKYDEAFWIKDIDELFERIFILAKYNALPYVMRHENAYSSKYRGIYSNIAAWGNQPNLFFKFDFRSFCKYRGMPRRDYPVYKGDTDRYLRDGGRKLAAWRYMEDFEKENGDISSWWFDIIPDTIKL